MNVEMTKKRLCTEETERKSTESHKRVARYLQNTTNQKDERVNQKTICGSSPSSPWRKGKLKTPPQNKPGNCCNRLTEKITILPTNPTPSVGL
jgi:hypothetical protein